MSIDKTKRVSRVFRAKLGKDSKVTIYVGRKRRTIFRETVEEFNRRQEGLFPVILGEDEYLVRLNRRGLDGGGGTVDPPPAPTLSVLANTYFRSMTFTLCRLPPFTEFDLAPIYNSLHQHTVGINQPMLGISRRQVEYSKEGAFPAITEYSEGVTGIPDSVSGYGTLAEGAFTYDTMYQPAILSMRVRDRFADSDWGPWSTRHDFQKGSSWCWDQPGDADESVFIEYLLDPETGQTQLRCTLVVIGEPYP